MYPIIIKEHDRNENMNTERHNAKIILDEYESAVDIHFQELIKKTQSEVQKTCDKWGWEFEPEGVSDFSLQFPGNDYMNHSPSFLMEFLEPEVYDLIRCVLPGKCEMAEYLKSAEPVKSPENDFMLEIDEDYKYKHPAVHRICELGIEEAAPGMIYFGAVTYDLIQRIMEVFASDSVNGRKLIACLPKFKP